jgi:hypothetical protein
MIDDKDRCYYCGRGVPCTFTLCYGRICGDCMDVKLEAETIIRKEEEGLKKLRIEMDQYGVD